MKKYESVIDSIFLSNNGEIDLLTGAIAPDRFDQIVKRDLAMAQRNSTNISMISTAVNLTQFFEDNQTLDSLEQQSMIENELVNLHFNLKSTFRQSDCICRVSKLGFWILLNGADSTTADQLADRLLNELPKFITVGMSVWQQGESILDWYKRVDQIHFNNN
jgi:GGDEF domain-containing protein